MFQRGYRGFSAGRTTLYSLLLIILLALVNCVEPEDFSSTLEIKDNWDYEMDFTGTVRSKKSNLPKHVEKRMFENYRGNPKVKVLERKGSGRYYVAYRDSGNILTTHEHMGKFFNVSSEGNEVTLTNKSLPDGKNTKREFIIRTQRPVLRTKNLKGVHPEYRWKPSPTNRTFEIVFERQTQAEIAAQEKKEAELFAASRNFITLEEFDSAFMAEQEANQVRAKKKYKGSPVYLRGAIESVMARDKYSSQNSYFAMIVDEKALAQQAEGTVGHMVTIFSKRAICDVTEMQALKLEKGDLVDLVGTFDRQDDQFYFFQNCAIRKRGKSQDIALMIKNLADSVSALTLALENERPLSVTRAQFARYRKALDDVKNTIASDPKSCNYVQLPGGPLDQLASEQELEKLQRAVTKYRKKFPDWLDKDEAQRVVATANEVQKICGTGAKENAEDSSDSEDKSDTSEKSEAEVEE